VTGVRKMEGHGTKSKLVILSPVAESPVEQGALPPRSHGRARFRIATLVNGKPNARALISGLLAGLRPNTLVESIDSFAKPGASFGLSPETFREIEAGHDLVLNGVGD
jgi:hypothetical protein